mgnify:FL=1
MTKKIFWSILLVAGIVLIASFVTIMDSLYRYFSSLQLAQMESQLNFAVQGVELSGISYLEGLDGENYRLTLIQSDGTVLYDNMADVSTLENHSDREEIREAMETGEGESSRYSGVLTEETLYLAKRLSDSSVLRIAVSHASVFSIAAGMFYPFIIVFLLTVVLAVVLAVKLSKSIVKPLNELSFENPLENDVYDEFIPMLRHMDSQNKKIKEQMISLKNSSNEFLAITENMSEGLVLLNEKGIIISINSSAEELFTADKNCIGKDFLTIERNPEVTKTLAKSTRDGYSETKISIKGRDYLFRASRIENGEEFVGSVLLLIDITDKNRAETLRREFTANVSHELKTPLQSIIGSAELMENGMVKPDDIPRFVGHIRAEASRLLSLINDIIKLSQLDEERSLPEEIVDIFVSAEDVREILNHSAKKRNIEFLLSGEHIKIRGVRQLIFEIIYNLCDNAIKYNKENGKVELRVYSDSNNAIISVSDTGIGIPPEDIDRVFERFYRVDKSHSKETGGTGLGLSIVKHSVGYLNGQINIESKPGEGTVVTVVFPLDKKDFS